MASKPPLLISAWLLILVVGLVNLAGCTGSRTQDPGTGAGQPTPGTAATTPKPRLAKTSTPSAAIMPTSTAELPTATAALAIDEDSVFFACLTKRGEDFGPAGPWELLDQATVVRPTEGVMELPGGNYHVCAYALAANQPASLALELAVLTEDFAVVPLRSSHLGQYYYFALIDENVPYRYTILNAQDLNVIELTLLGPGDQVVRQDQLRILGKPPKPQPTPTKKK